MIFLLVFSVLVSLVSLFLCLVGCVSLMMKIKFLVLILIFALISSSLIVLAIPPHKEHPGNSGKKKPPIVGSLVTWYDVSFGCSVIVDSIVNDSGVWGVWSPWWSVWNVLSDVPVVGDYKVVSVRWW